MRVAQFPRAGGQSTVAGVAPRRRAAEGPEESVLGGLKPEIHPPPLKKWVFIANKQICPRSRQRRAWDAFPSAQMQANG